MRKVLKNKAMVISIVLTALLVVGGIIAIVVVNNSSTKDPNKDQSEPVREYEILGEDESEELIDDSLDIADTEDEVDDMRDNAFKFPSNTGSDSGANQTTPSDDSGEGDSDNTQNNNSDDVPDENPDDGGMAPTENGDSMSWGIPY